MKGWRHIILIDGRGLSIYRWNAGKVLAQELFPATAAGQAGFRNHLGRHPRERFDVLTNLGEESYRQETIPVLPAGERRVVIERRLARHFPGCRYATAISLGHEASRRRNERLLLAALNAERLDPWIEILEETGALLGSIHSAAFFAGILTRRLVGRHFSGIVLTLLGENLRESYVEQGLLRFSRLAEHPGSDSDTLAKTLAAETIRLQQYLRSQQMLDSSEVLRVLIIAAPADLPPIRAHCIDSAALVFDIRDAVDCAKRLGLGQPPGDKDFATAYIHLLANTPPKPQFAGASLRHRYLVRQVGTAINAGGAAIVVACLLFSGQRWLAAEELRHDAAQEKTEGMALGSQRHPLAQERPQLPFPAATLQGIVDAHSEIVRRDISPETILGEISAALDRSPGIEISRLEWHSDTAEKGSRDMRNTVVHGQIVAHATAGETSSSSPLRGLASVLRTNPRLTVTLGDPPSRPAEDWLPPQSFMLQLRWSRE